MTEHKQRDIRLALAGRGITLADVGRHCDPPVTRQYVRMVTRGERVGRRVRAAIVQALGWDPWAGDSRDSAA